MGTAALLRVVEACRAWMPVPVPTARSYTRPVPVAAAAPLAWMPVPVPTARLFMTPVPVAAAAPLAWIPVPLPTARGYTYPAPVGSATPPVPVPATSLLATSRVPVAAAIPRAWMPVPVPVGKPLGWIEVSSDAAAGKFLQIKGSGQYKRLSVVGKGPTYGIGRGAPAPVPMKTAAATVKDWRMKVCILVFERRKGR